MIDSLMRIAGAPGAYLLIYPQERLVVATLLNSDQSIIDARRVGEFFLRVGP